MILFICSGVCLSLDKKVLLFLYRSEVMSITSEKEEEKRAELQDITIICRDCGRAFVRTAGE
ncbi:hypothetical protein AwErysi_00050 [Erysipelotrichaceae bacterium]|nr:hypothetical protein AwErysi_00050 [Erysipelotrichaceae bacterium]